MIPQKVTYYIMPIIAERVSTNSVVGAFIESIAEIKKTQKRLYHDILN